jgi:hypothetical protein
MHLGSSVAGSFLIRIRRPLPPTAAAWADIPCDGVDAAGSAFVDEDVVHCCLPEATGPQVWL